MTWLTLWFALQMGLAPNSAVVTYPENEVTFYPQTGYTQLEVEARIAEVFFIGGNIRTEVQDQVGQLNFYPELISCGLSAGVRWKGIELVFLHECQHPSGAYYGRYHPVLNWEGAYTEVYLRLSGEAKLF